MYRSSFFAWAYKAQQKLQNRVNQRICTKKQYKFLKYLNHEIEQAIRHDEEDFTYYI